jgi:OOP family OmpA-OmpF porin
MRLIGSLLLLALASSVALPLPAQERDSDGDGVPDLRDRCPGSPRGLTMDATGCESDTDGDGVLESKDRCPGTERGDSVDANGCSMVLRLRVTFAKNSTRWSTDSVSELNRAIVLMSNAPTARAVIEAYTDSAGSAEHNLRLSQRRARAVRDFVVSHGIAASRISARGFGESQPIADERTPEGREQNRRILLRRIDQP